MRLLPPVWTALIAGAQRGLAATAGGPRDYAGRRELTAALTLGAGALYAAVGWQFWRARTTIDPRDPARTTALVTEGVFAGSRNPIYVADALLLVAHAAWLGRPLTLLGVPALVAALEPQVLAEEAALAERFGEDYRAYRARVPRWVGPRR